MKNVLSSTLIATVAIFSISAPTLASGGFNEQNLPFGVDAPVSDHVFAPGSEAVIFSFPSASSTVVGSNGFIDGEQAGFFWSVARGDSVTETFSGPGNATSYTLDVDVITNSLVMTAVNWDVLINGVLVDNFDVAPGFVGTVSRAAMFTSIPGPNYTVELRVTNEVEGGGGSHTLRYAGIGLNEIDISGGAEGTVLCLDSFCDTFDCGLDADGVHTCRWNWNCAGTDLEDMIGFKVGPTFTLGGEINSQLTTWGWRIDAPGRFMELFRFDGVGQSTLQATDTFSLNSCDFAAPRPGQSILESLEQ